MDDYKLHLGDREVSTDDLLKEITSSYPNEDIETLQARLAEDGYLCMRGLIPREAILAARRVLYDNMKEQSEDSTFDYPKGRGGSYMGNKEITHTPEFLGAVENPKVFEFFDALFGEKSCTFDYKWARAVPEKAAGTQAHMDYVYMGRGSARLHTMWTPMGDIERQNGPMVILDKSHTNPALEKIRQTYGLMDVDRGATREGWFTSDYKELSDLSGEKWLVSDYQAGDVIIMGMHLFHGSLRNEIDKVRFTCDVRFQPAADPIDDRWVGENPKGHGRAPGEEPEKWVTMAEAREAWGV